MDPFQGHQSAARAEENGESESAGRCQLRPALASLPMSPTLESH